MKPYFPTKALEEENDRLVNLMLNSSEDISIQEFTDKYASEEFKKFILDRQDRRKRLLLNGVIEN